jgi:UDP:flavonoid glycosyltransferase YjiC (YdhE family)
VLANSVAPYGHDLAEGLGIPSIGTHLQPMEPSAAYPPVALGLARSAGPWGNRALGRLVRAAPAPYDAACARMRREFGLPAESRRSAERRRRAAGLPVYYGISPVVLPRPADWHPALHLDGFWWPVPPPEWQPPPALVTFLEAGPPPVVLGFGSTTLGPRTTTLVAAALRAAGVRAVVQGAATDSAPGVLAVGDVPHDWLFRRAAAVVHHAGAGTTAAGLRAGVPAVAVPLSTDQPLWAARIAALGAGPQPVPASRLTAERLAAAIRAAVTDERYREGAQGVARALAAEDAAAGVLARLRALAP